MSSSSHDQIMSGGNQIDGNVYLQPLACSLVHPSSVQFVKKMESSVAIKAPPSNVSSSAEEPNHG